MRIIRKPPTGKVEDPLNSHSPGNTNRAIMMDMRRVELETHPLLNSDRRYDMYLNVKSAFKEYVEPPRHMVGPTETGRSPRRMGARADYSQATINPSNGGTRV